MIDSFLQMLRGAVLSLPATELAALILILTACLVFRFNRTGLVTSYLFSYHWGWAFFVGEQQRYLFLYLVFGVLVGILTVVGMLKSPK